jgi:ABC-type spermidine/putrescine transport system permease subunit I
MASIPTRPSRWWSGRSLVIGLPFAWLLLFFLAPFLIVMRFSVSEMGVVAVQDVTQTNKAQREMVAVEQAVMEQQTQPPEELILAAVAVVVKSTLVKAAQAAQV